MGTTRQQILPMSRLRFRRFAVVPALVLLAVAVGQSRAVAQTPLGVLTGEGQTVTPGL